MTDTERTPKAGPTAAPVSSITASESGVLSVSSEDYHADLLPGQGPPSLSASMAHLLLSRSPKHAWARHPRLNPDFVREEDAKFDLGRAVHQVLLEGNKNIVVVEENDWRKAAAKEAREQAWSLHMTALLSKDWERVLEMVEAVVAQLAEVDVDPIPLVSFGQPEATLSWEEPNGVHCRCRIDWLHDGNRAISDLKTTKASANPEAWCRSTLWSIGADIQVAAYTRAVEVVHGVTPEFTYVVVETEPPFALSLISLAPSALEIGRAKWETAVEIWGRCLDEDDWPSYPTRVAYAELPTWEEARWLEREAREA